MLFRIFSLKETTSVAIVSVLITIICIALIVAILLFVFLRKGMLKITFSKPTKTIFGRSLNLNNDAKQEKIEPKDDDSELAPMKITIFDIKEEQKKFDTAQRETIKNTKNKKGK